MSKNHHLLLSELEQLDTLVLSSLNPESYDHQFEQKDLLQCQNTAIGLRGKIKVKLCCATFLIVQEKDIRTYVQTHQAKLCYLMDYVSELYSNHLCQEEEIYKQTLDIINGVLSELLLFLSIHFTDYFNFDEKATDSVKQEKIVAFKNRISLIEAILYAQNSELLILSLSPVQEFIEGKNNTQITFRILRYFEMLLSKIESIAKSGKPLNDSLKFALICINFNTYRFLRYLTQEIESNLKDEYNESLRISKLSWYLKSYNQINETPGYVLKLQQPSIRVQISNWLLEEIGYLEKVLQLSKLIGGSSLNLIPIDFKLQTDLSVAQLGYLIRIFLETGVFKNHNHRDVLKFFSSHTSTRQVDSISAKSLSAKFYNAEGGTRESIKEIVINMLNEINKRG